MGKKTMSEKMADGIAEGLSESLNKGLGDLKVCVNGRCDIIEQKNTETAKAVAVQIAETTKQVNTTVDALDKKIEARIAALEAKLGESKGIDEKLAVLEKKLVGCIGNECAYIRSNIQTLQIAQAEADAEAQGRPIPPRRVAGSATGLPPVQETLTPPPQRRRAPPPAEEEEAPKEEEVSEEEIYKCPTCQGDIAGGVTTCPECGEKIKWEED